jgi:hypothetical protein
MFRAAAGHGFALKDNYDAIRAHPLLQSKSNAALFDPHIIIK